MAWRLKYFRILWGSRVQGCSVPGLETPLTFDPWQLLFFFVSENVDVSELLGSAGSFRCWLNREVESSCITITCDVNNSNNNNNNNNNQMDHNLLCFEYNGLE